MLKSRRQANLFAVVLVKAQCGTHGEGPVGPVPGAATRTEVRRARQWEKSQAEMAGEWETGRERWVLLRRVLSRDLREKAMEALAG